MNVIGGRSSKCRGSSIKRKERLIYDNSGSAPRLVARKANGKLVLLPDAPVNLIRALGQDAG